MSEGVEKAERKAAGNVLRISEFLSLLVLFDR